MNGVEILNEYEVVTERQGNVTVGFIVWCVVAVAAIGFGLYMWLSGDYAFVIVPALAILGILGGIVLGGLFGGLFSRPVEYATEYEVQISPEVSMLEFTDKYEIIEQRGQIFVVREKTK